MIQKTYIAATIIANMLAATPVVANHPCEDFGILAEGTMAARQAGSPKKEVLEILAELGPISDVQMYMVNEAYKRPIHDASLLRQTSERFRELMTQQCYEWMK